MSKFIPDLHDYSPYSSGDRDKDFNVVAIGWLSSEHPYNVGYVPSEFRTRLEIFCSDPLIMNFAVDICPICQRLEAVTIELSSGEKISLYGTYEIRIPSQDGKKVYAASDFIIHHVVVHHYKPPQEFIDSVLAAPLPGTPEFEAFAKPWK